MAVDRGVSSGKKSVSSCDSDESGLDPRIYIELEKLNKASDDINTLELELDEARAVFRQILTESTHQLNSLAKKLGSCIEKARPYYDARMKAIEAQACTQNAALRFERACSQLTAAKEMVNLAEQGYFKMGQPFDPAWQEMLNHSTIKVNDAERERLESEIEHRLTAQLFNEAEQAVKRLQKDWKQNITKSRPYFEMKAKFNQQMEDQKKKVQQLEFLVGEAKTFYADTLHSLERISDEIHEKRRLQKKRTAKVKSGVIYHPLMDSRESSFDDETVLDDSTKSDSGLGNTNGESVEHKKIDSLDTSVASPPSVSNAEKSNMTVDLTSTADSNVADPSSPGESSQSGNDNSVKTFKTQPTPTSSSIGSPEVDANSDVVVTRTSRPFLRPNSSREDVLGDGGSETESITSSFASANMLDDEQIESLMLETADYQKFLAKMDALESDRFKQMSLPAKLSYLKNYVKFEPIWVDEDLDRNAEILSDPELEMDEHFDSFGNPLGMKELNNDEASAESILSPKPKDDNVACKQQVFEC